MNYCLGGWVGGRTHQYGAARVKFLISGRLFHDGASGVGAVGNRGICVYTKRSQAGALQSTSTRQDRSVLLVVKGSTGTVAIKIPGSRKGGKAQPSTSAGNTASCTPPLVPGIAKSCARGVGTRFKTSSRLITRRRCWLLFCRLKVTKYPLLMVSFCTALGQMPHLGKS